MDVFPDLASISDDDLHEQMRELELEEERVSHRRRRMHGQIDALRLERIARLRKHVEAGDDVGADAGRVAQAVTRPDEPLEEASPESAEPEPIPEPIVALRQGAARPSRQARARGG